MLRLLLLFRNARPWLTRCLVSICSQSVTEWHCHVVDDLSDDGSWEHFQKIVPADRRFTLVRNTDRLYQCGSTRRILDDPTLNDHDICVAIDGDDYLPDPFVLQRVLDAYSDGKTWVTWGSEIRTDGVPDCNAPLLDVALLRKVPWRTSHLRTWKLFLWRRIRHEDFLGPDGQPLRVGGDLASMYPMIEMAGNARIKYLPSVNYVYNRDNPLNNFRIRTNEQLNNGEFLKSKPPYSQLSGSFEQSILQSASALRETPERLGQTLPSIVQSPLKVFGVGLPGTEHRRSHLTLWQIGYRTIVNPPLLALDEALKKYDAAMGEAVAFRFRELDKQYTRSKFILTVCDPKKWLAEISSSNQDDDNSPAWEREMKLSLYGSGELSTNQLLQAYHRHVTMVTEYFSTRPDDLLIVDAQNENWLKAICDFLEDPVQQELLK